jgi:predicted esterase
MISSDSSRSIEKQIEPESGREYLLYRPARYDRASAWPLIVLCHSGFPDSASGQVQEWAVLADEYGFLVIAPRIDATRGALTRAGAQEPTAMKRDEAAILSSVEHVRAGHNVSEDRIFIQGQSGGAGSALFTGLRNREVFRAISLSQPRFDRADMTDVTVYVDPHQPVLLNFRSSDVMTGKQGRECADWLRAYGADLRLEPIPATNHPQRAIEFFQDVIRKEPWIRVHATPSEGASNLSLRFKMSAPAPPSRFRWQFSDGDESPVAEPVHVFPKAGRHRVVVTVELPKLGEHTRYLDVEVPSGTVLPAHGSP